MWCRKVRDLLLLNGSKTKQTTFFLSKFYNVRSLPHGIVSCSKMKRTLARFRPCHINSSSISILKKKRKVMDFYGQYFLNHTIIGPMLNWQCGKKRQRKLMYPHLSILVILKWTRTNANDFFFTWVPIW